MCEFSTLRKAFPQMIFLPFYEKSNIELSFSLSLNWIDYLLEY